MSDTKVIVVRTREQLKRITAYLKKKKLKATDIETSTLSVFDTHTAPMVGCTGFACGTNKAYVYPIHSRVGVEIEFSPEEGLAAVAELWEDMLCEYILHFGKLDYTYMGALHAIWLQGFLNHPTGYSYDTGQAHYCLKETNFRGDHDLKTLAWKIGMGGYEQPFEEYKKLHPEASKNYCLVPGRLLYPYCGMDCIATFRLFLRERRQLKKKGLWEKPFLFPQMYNNWTAGMLEITGIRTNLKRNSKLAKLFPRKIAEVDKELLALQSVQRLQDIRWQKIVTKTRERVRAYKRPVKNPEQLIKEFANKTWAKSPLKWTSDDRRILIYDILKYEPDERTKTKTGLYSVAKKVVVKLFRQRKRNSTVETLQRRGLWFYGHSKYVKPIPGWVGSDKRTHTEYMPHGQRTGRVGSKKPNHENIPKREPTIAPLIRSQFKPRSREYVAVAGDGKQMELRLIADRAPEPTMLDEFEAKKDPHRMGAAAFFEIPEKEVTKVQRDESKSMVSFGIIYGRGDEALAWDFGKSVEWAAEKRKRYFGKYKHIPDYWKYQENFVEEHGYVLSKFGRHRRLPGVESDEKSERSRALRQAINAPIQGDGSDIVWTAAHRLTRWLLKYKMQSKAVFRQQRFMFYRKSRPMIVIHDDITGDVYRPELQDYIEHLQKYMIDREYIEKMTGWYCTCPLDLDISIYQKDLGSSIELQRSGEDFVIPREFQ